MKKKLKAEKKTKIPYSAIVKHKKYLDREFWKIFFIMYEESRVCNLSIKNGLAIFYVLLRNARKGARRQL